MKFKLLLSATLLSTALIGAHQADAKQYDVVTQSYKNKVYAGKASFGGLKPGLRVANFKYKKGYKFEDFLVGNSSGYDIVRYGYNAHGYTNFQENKPFWNRTISEVEMSKIKRVNRSKIQSVYGKPLYSSKQSISIYDGYIDIYKNIAFISTTDYDYDTGIYGPITLERAILIDANTKAEMKKWYNILKVYGSDQGSLTYKDSYVWKRA
ncbi:hypothetical protein [Macrococcus equi]|uniref:hypothetical protein n=1 Tax=Macrococcus equi TaxID=3395462 RepID=UPI0039BE9386